MISEESEPAHEQAWPPSTRTAARSSARGPAGAILVVDDDTAWLADLERWLTDDGLRVISISRGEWVVQAVDFHEPDAVLLDVNLPGADGLEILAQLRRRRPDVPVIVMTAFGGAEIEERARRLGAADYFDKPFRMTALATALRRVRRCTKGG
jgi:two-component system, NtrC family, C4-dicarboxylate transport response regulator DctD